MKTRKRTRQFTTFIRKEFAHVIRDRRTLLILFGLPIVQIIIFGFALSNEVKNAKIVVLDNARDNVSRGIIEKIEASKYFEVEERPFKPGLPEAAFREGDVSLVAVFPSGFGSDLLHYNRATVQLIADASDPNTANTLTNYLTSIVMDYPLLSGASASPPLIRAQLRMLYNPQLKGAPNFVPGVMALVLMLVCVMMTSISIVREKELGTMEVLLVSPFNPLLVLLSKAVPYLLLSLINVASIVLLSVFVLDLPVQGSVALLFAESTLFIITSLSLGLFISVKAKTQETAMLASMMGMLLPTILFSGFMFPLENMPRVLQYLSNIVPAKWYYLIVKAVMVKGLGIAAIWKETVILLGISVFFLAVSFKQFKIRLE